MSGNTIENLKSSSVYFGWRENESLGIYSVSNGVGLDLVTMELLQCITDVSGLLEQKHDICLSQRRGLSTDISLHELRLALARLDQASALGMSIGNSLEVID